MREENSKKLFEVNEAKIEKRIGEKNGEFLRFLI